MADAKYGRLFTEQDVTEIVREALAGDLDPENFTRQGEFQEIVSKDRKFPADEPLFVIRGQDQLAPTVVQNYLAAAAANGTQPDFQDLVAGSLNDIKSFQRDNADRVKLPD